MKKTLIGLAVTALAPVMAHATFQEDVERFLEGSYGGASLGVESRVSEFCNGEPVCNDLREVPWKFWGGWRVSETLGMEVGYINFGTIRNQGQLSSVPGSPMVDTVVLRSRAIVLNAAPTWQMTPTLATIGRIGVASVKSETKGASVGTTDFSGDSKTELYLGLGVNYQIGRVLAPDSMPIMKGFSLEFGWDTTRVNVSGERKWVNMFSMGGGFEF